MTSSDSLSGRRPSAPPGDRTSREFQALAARGFKPYSRGHRIMYEVPLTLMTRVRDGAAANRSGGRYAILEAGFGIGWGLDRMIEAGVIARYVGYEPDPESFAHVASRHGGEQQLTLIDSPFEWDGDLSGRFDHAFCIEVMEHVAPERHQRFLADLRRATKGTLWLSTADSDRSSHGVRTTAAWLGLIGTAGFPNVTVHEEQWTTLFICQ